MTLVLNGNCLLLEGSNPKIETNGVYIYNYIRIAMFLPENDPNNFTTPSPPTQRKMGASLPGFQYVAFT